MDKENKEKASYDGEEYKVWLLGKETPLSIYAKFWNIDGDSDLLTFAANQGTVIALRWSNVSHFYPMTAINK